MHFLSAPRFWTISFKLLVPSLECRKCSTMRFRRASLCAMAFLSLCFRRFVFQHTRSASRFYHVFVILYFPSFYMTSALTLTRTPKYEIKCILQRRTDPGISRWERGDAWNFFSCMCLGVWTTVEIYFW